jgi:transposase
VRLNLIGALCITPGGRKIKLHVQSYRKSIRGEQVVHFLTHLLKHVNGPIVLLWDRHPIHRRRSVQEFLGTHPRVHVYEFPTSAPELNPTEFVWTQLTDFTANTAPHHEAELRRNIFAGIARIRRSPSRRWACIFASDLSWKR